ncbi:MAG: hypothetical protein EOP52_13820 [Sphingobacteriales bacterium]|nr:MAG: hypothetical protein EOP52_13820 [Sphingobacteriales bacterium]
MAARGLLSEETRTNFLLNSASPSSQTVSLNAGSYTLWVEGAGSCVCAAGTAAGSGFGTATAGSKVTFSISTAGTVVFTVTGGLARFQCENGIAETSFITTTSAAATRAGDVCGANMSSVLNAQEGTVFVQGTVGHGQPSALGMDDGSGGAATRMHIMLTATARTYFVNIDNVARINGNDSGLMAIGTPVKVAGTYGPQGSALYVNGMVAASSGTASGGLNVSHLRIGSRNLPTAGRQLNGWIQRAAYYRQSLGLESIKKIME